LKLGRAGIAGRKAASTKMILLRMALLNYYDVYDVNFSRLERGRHVGELVDEQLRREIELAGQLAGRKVR
jgi:hypothetical protein